MDLIFTTTTVLQPFVSDVVFGLGHWLSLRTKSQLLVLALALKVWSFVLALALSLKSLLTSLPYVQDNLGEPVSEETCSLTPILIINHPLSASSITHTCTQTIKPTRGIGSERECTQSWFMERPNSQRRCATWAIGKRNEKCSMWHSRNCRNAQA